MNLRPSAAAVFLSSLSLLACGPAETTAELEPSPPKPTESASRIHYAVTRVSGSYGGGAQKVINGGVDTIADVRCAFDSTGTNANQNPFVGDPANDTWTTGITVKGEANCPAATGSSSGKAATCQAGTHVQTAPFQWSVEVTGWADDAEVFLRADAPAVLPVSCNFASVLGEQGHPWGLVAKTTVGKFRAGVPFEVRFVGNNTLAHDGNTSEVGWDLSVEISPR